MNQRFTLLVICTIAGIQLADLFTSSTQARSSDCPGYQWGDLNRWAEQEGNRLSGRKPAYYEMPTSAAPQPQPQARIQPQAQTQLPATVAESRGLTEEQWRAGQRTSPTPAPTPVASRDPLDTSAIDAEVDAGNYQPNTDENGNPIRRAAPSSRGGENVGL